MIAAFDVRIVLIGAIVLVIVVVLGYRLLNRDPSVRRTRYGVFVERDHYDDLEEPTWPQRQDEIEP